jgi:hypothetical protein
MSEQEQVPAGDRIASPREVANFFQDDCRTLRDSLQLEMVVAQYDVRMRDVLSPEGIPLGDVVPAGVIAALERKGDPLCHAILRGLQYLGTGVAAQRSADAVARLSERGVGLPARFADVGEARAVGAWRDTEGAFDGEFSLFVDFEFPRGTRHALAIFVEPRHGGVIKHLGLTQPMSEIDYPNVMEPLEIHDAGTLLNKVLERTHSRGLDDTDDFRVLIAAARARGMGSGGAALGLAAGAAAQDGNR